VTGLPSAPVAPRRRAEPFEATSLLPPQTG
jgi:hypothetical protein